MNKEQKQQAHSELRQDMISGDWVLIAPGRAKRTKASVVKHEQTPKSACPFENLLVGSGGEMPLLQYGKQATWRLGVIENKYPALTHQANCPVFLRKGPYNYIGGIGRHELIITRDHRKNFSELTSAAALEVFTAAQQRFSQFKNDDCLQYVSFYQNYGARAGASQSHPHYQIIALPVIPPEVSSSLQSSKKYFAKNRKCAHCAMLSYERNQKERIVYENSHAIALAPFASTHGFELRVFPRKHYPRFEDTPKAELVGVVSALQKVLGALKKELGDPDYNFFVHTIPIKTSDHKEYHWHIEIMPRTEIFAGFELSTGMVINQTMPEEAAQLLRKAL